MIRVKFDQNEERYSHYNVYSEGWDNLGSFTLDHYNKEVILVSLPDYIIREYNLKKYEDFNSISTKGEGIFNAPILQGVLSEEDKEFLRDLKHELLTQDNRCTASPFFYQIRTQELQMTSEWESTHVCVTMDGEDYVYKNDIRNLKKLAQELDIPYYEDMFWEDLSPDFDINYCIYRDKIENNAFLTQKYAELHIKQNKHNYYKPVSFVAYAYKNIELERLIDIIKKLDI